MIECKQACCRNRWYHCDCINMALDKIPMGPWCCHLCNRTKKEITQELIEYQPKKKVKNVKSGDYCYGELIC